ncbi:type I restriction endonuclease subunit R [Litorimonas sp.]|uniref:type I restriction endonuclease subunit R n=1 Tax=Litorimonas sp. TaxID=1892381 RepID=UPI003A8960F7
MTATLKTQSEAQLEENLIERLGGLGYTRVTIPDEAALLSNLKTQLEKFSKTTFTPSEFDRIVNHLDQGNVFDRAGRLRDWYNLTRDDGTSDYIRFMNTEHWCRNEYQVTNQISMEGSYKTRYDVTLLINGLPLVQIELKRRGLELKEAFNQINRYHRHSFWAETGLFQYVQIFVISNGVNSKYYANNRVQSFKQTFYWADESNGIITQLDKFADAFLEKCHISKMIAKYTVLHQSDQILMVLRPYQYYAAEKIVDKVKNSHDNGYIWHTTGSGKTLTSFKAAQVIMDLPKVDKVIFVVDRADLDYQTTKEFNHFSEGSVDGTDNTRALVKQFSDDTPLIVTTIQKLNTAISPGRYQAAMEAMANQRVVFIFDECHRSQFGDTHKRIVDFFPYHQMFGFTGTPIFKENAGNNKYGKRTTKMLFGDCLHKYVITDAIRDQNVLKFAVEYWGRLDLRDGLGGEEKVSALDLKEFWENEDRISHNIDWIIENHRKKTHDKQFSAMLCVGSVNMLIKYYDAFKAKKEAGEHNLRVGAIFTYGTNEDDLDADGLLDDISTDLGAPQSVNKHTRDKLEEMIADYNAIYKTKFSTQNKQFYAYYKDLSKRMKDREKKSFKDADRLDILLVVNMFLTGFDAKMVNTLYVDKRLRYHGLIQAYSRTNRIINERKSQGNIVVFRNLKDETDEAITLFSNINAKEGIIIEPYRVHVNKFNAAVEILLSIVATPEGVNTLPSEIERLEFIKAFRNLIRIRNVLITFSEFTYDDLKMSAQRFEDFKSKYLDLYEETRFDDEDEKSSIIDDVDFELELIQRDEINVAYILALLAKLVDEDEDYQAMSDEDKADTMKSVLKMLETEVQLRSKRDLIEKFIADQMPKISSGDQIQTAFNDFWDQEKTAAFNDLCVEEGLEQAKVERVIYDYQFTGRKPLRESVVGAMQTKPKILERKTVIERVTDKILKLVRTFEDDIGGE